MAKASVIIGIVAVGLFVVTVFTMRVFIHGEEDWNLGIALALSVLASLVIGLVGAMASVVAMCRKPHNRLLAIVALALNLTPLALYALSRIAGE